jgi:hypothetical protein
MTEILRRFEEIKRVVDTPGMIALGKQSEGK